MEIRGCLTFFKRFFLEKKKKNTNFAPDLDDDPVGALAFTDFSKPSPVLEGEDAERFIMKMAEAEKNARDRSERSKTKEEIEGELCVKKMLLDFQQREIDNLKKEIEILEKLHAEKKEQRFVFQIQSERGD